MWRLTFLHRFNNGRTHYKYRPVDIISVDILRNPSATPTMLFCKIRWFISNRQHCIAVTATELAFSNCVIHNITQYAPQGHLQKNCSCRNNENSKKSLKPSNLLQKGLGSMLTHPCCVGLRLRHRPAKARRMRPQSTARSRDAHQCREPQPIASPTSSTPQVATLAEKHARLSFVSGSRELFHFWTFGSVLEISNRLLYQRGWIKIRLFCFRGLLYILSHLKMGRDYEVFFCFFWVR